MIVLIAALVVAGAAVYAGQQIAGALGARREDATRARLATLLQTFGHAQAAAQADPRALLAWQPVAKTARGLFPEEFAALDRAAGATFPFTKSNSKPRTPAGPRTGSRGSARTTPSTS